MLLSFFIFAMILIYCFQTAFYVKPNHHDDLHDVPKSEQYAPYYDQMITLIDELDAEPYEKVEVKSFDGLTLRGRLYLYDENAPIEIAFNGYRTTGVHDAGGVFKLARKAGHNFLVVDQRATGESDGKIISFGINERYDVLSWINYVNQRFGKQMKIILIGGSLGGATVLMSSNLNLPNNVVGIIADSAYTSPKAIIKKVIKTMHLPANILYPFVKLAAKIFGNFNLEDSAAIEAVKHTNLPILIIHGKADRYVPCYMARQNYAACSSKNKHLLLVPGGPHDISLLADWNSYQNAVNDFFNEIGV